MSPEAPMHRSDINRGSKTDLPSIMVKTRGEVVYLGNTLLKGRTGQKVRRYYCFLIPVRFSVHRATNRLFLE